MQQILALMIPLAPFLMVVAIVWMKNQRRLEEKRLDAAANHSAEAAARHATQVAELENRVRVLERIVTDKGYDVASQIEALRDQQRVDEQGAGTPLDIRNRENA
ncbi:hypothetical protein F7D01_04355 [Erythrobacter sp. 3-20A1M]|uniref:hypothetical protein n=1 Tax=Erythrobacter sp. 3-20A1M TaxID=2653850 RepID=UPI001BFC771F|nr:hypothetical protein [Erythrobacter sp. 3-20A1M]QWC56425.1 hypothetical protein F7D01_04355 [Erythrobacter sp. 3-20A1M]